MTKLEMIAGVLALLLMSTTAQACSAKLAEPETAARGTGPSPTQVPPPTSPATPTRVPTKPTPPSPPSPTAAVTSGPTPTLGAAACPAPSGVEPVLTQPTEYVQDTLVLGLEPQILAYLDASGGPGELISDLSSMQLEADGITSELNAQVISRDLTGDSVPEVLVSVLLLPLNAYFYEGALWVFTCSEGRYQQIAAEYAGGYGARPTEILRAIVDMNSNGRSEIVFVVFVDYGDGIIHREFRIIEWSGARFVDLAEYPSAYPKPCGEHPKSICEQFADGAVVDFDADGIPEFILVIDENIGFLFPSALADLSLAFPSKIVWQIWDWDGAAVTLMQTFQAPRFRRQAVRDADGLSAWREYEMALAFYQEAIFDQSLRSWSSGPFGESAPKDERANLEAYSRYRIMLIHTILGNASAAKTSFDTLQTKFPAGTPGHPYAELAKVFWEKYIAGAAPEEACLRAVDHARMNEDAIVGPLSLTVYAPYPYFDYHADSVCEW